MTDRYDGKPPGSEAAIEAGCSCPVLDNNHGLGAYRKDDTGEALYWINEKCPLHVQREKKEGGDGDPV